MSKETQIPRCVIKSFHESQSLVGVDRDPIDYNTVHGFIVDYNEEWILLHHVYDFFLEGWVLLRISDISALQSKTKDVFQKALLEEEGVLNQIDFTHKIPKGGVEQLLREFGREKVIILEKETEEEDEFNIGFVREVEAGEVSLDFFTGVGRIEDDERIMNLSEITSISYGSNYALFYERYFERQRD